MAEQGSVEFYERLHNTQPVVWVRMKKPDTTLVLFDREATEEDRRAYRTEWRKYQRRKRK